MSIAFTVVQHGEDAPDKSLTVGEQMKRGKSRGVAEMSHQLPGLVMLPSIRFEMLSVVA